MDTLIKKYRNKDLYSLNCSESIVFAANEYYNLRLSENGLRMASGFGGGIFEKHLCGIVSGAVCVLGILFKGKTFDNKNLLEISINEFKEEFRKNYDNLECNYLLEHYRVEEQGCNLIIFKSADILKRVIDKYINNTI
ncbi:MAG: C-GCAxxG-C-C family protein [Firmicutes bacterium]|nr:C-GCAxxG-C-C family protein [Bacillota bacterium]